MRAAVFASDDRLLLRDVVARRRPDCMPVVDRLGSQPLIPAARDELREALTAELSATGLDEHDEPNRHGVRLERLIDLLGHV